MDTHSSQQTKNTSNSRNRISLNATTLRQAGLASFPPLPPAADAFTATVVLPTTDSHASHLYQPSAHLAQQSPNSFLMSDLQPLPHPYSSTSSFNAASNDSSSLLHPQDHLADAVRGLSAPMAAAAASALWLLPHPQLQKTSLSDPLNRLRRRDLDAHSSSLNSQSLLSPNSESDGIDGQDVSSPFRDQSDMDQDGVQDLVLPYEDFTTIDWMRDLMRDHRRKHRLISCRQPGWVSYLYSQFDSTQSWILVSMIGIVIGLVAAWIDIVAAWLTDFKQGVCITEWYLSKDICCTGLTRTDGYCRDFRPWSWVIFGAESNVLVNFVLYGACSVIFAGCSALMVARLANYAAGSGAAEIKTILGGFIIKEFLGLRTLVVKSISLPLAVASGLAVGKEGPMVHIACSIGNIFPRLFPKYKDNEARKREILSASAAAGIAVAFGSPIGGVLFSLEFFCALVSRVTLQFVDPYRGKRVMFQVTLSRNWYFFEMIFFVLLGVMGGLTGALVIRCNLWFQALRRNDPWFKSNPVREVIGIALLTAIVGYMNVFTRIDNLELLETLFKECTHDSDSIGLCNPQFGYTLVALVFALVIKTCLTIITLGIKVPAGIFIPAMVWGSLFGRILGIVVNQWQLAYSHLDLFVDCPPELPCVTPGMYALLGAMAGLGGVTKLTVSLTVIMFELTGTLNYIIPCMVTVMVAKLVGDMFGRGGMAEVMIRINRFPFLDPRAEEVIGRKICEAMTSIDHLVCFTGTGMTLADIDTMLDTYEYQGFPIIHSDVDTSLVGYITRGDLLYAIDKARLHHPVGSNTLVFFDNPDFWSSSRGDGQPGYVRGIGTPEFARRSPSTTSPVSNTVNFAYYVDQTPLGVDSTVPIEFVIDLFKKLGPRVIIIKEAGCLKGLITKKDLLATIYSMDDMMSSVRLASGSVTDVTLSADNTASSVRTSLASFGSVKPPEVDQSQEGGVQVDEESWQYVSRVDGTSGSREGDAVGLLSRVGSGSDTPGAHPYDRESI
ncbi:hypothetical protein BASA81_016426 [Batrachochytrium salamandrivorans]|nr:hypothetical protein BASA81_016426 [Batrachochytrium salamandrivorans]